MCLIHCPVRLRVCKIAQSSGTVGGSSSIQIRGASSIGAGSSLYLLLTDFLLTMVLTILDRTNGMVDVVTMQEISTLTILNLLTY